MEVGPAVSVSPHELPDEELSWTNLLMLWILTTSLLGHVATLTMLWWRCCSSSPAGGSSTVTTTGEDGHTSHGGSRLAPRTTRFGPNLSELILAGDPRRQQPVSESDKEKALKEKKEQITKEPEKKENHMETEPENFDTASPGQEHREEREMEELKGWFSDEDVGNEQPKAEQTERRGFSLLSFIPNSGWFAPSPRKRTSASPTEHPLKKVRKGFAKQTEGQAGSGYQRSQQVESQKFQTSSHKGFVFSKLGESIEVVQEENHHDTARSPSRRRTRATAYHRSDDGPGLVPQGGRIQSWGRHLWNCLQCKHGRCGPKHLFGSESSTVLHTKKADET